jgi:hypothetical protein
MTADKPKMMSQKMSSATIIAVISYFVSIHDALPSRDLSEWRT